MKHKLFLNLVVLLGLLSFTLDSNAGGNSVGNGGDVVHCKRSQQNEFSGYYSLDYLVQYSKDSQPEQSKTLEESLDRIENLLSQKLPELAADFKDFRRDLFNETNFQRHHIWDKAPFGLVDLKDEELVTQLPENCRNGERTDIVQAVVRLPPKITGLPEDKINYKYVEQVVDELKQNGPVQLSFLLVHEWLWSFSNNVERNRRINYWLHSPNGDAWSREVWLTNLQSLGFAVPNMQPPVWEQAICDYDQNTVNKILNYRNHNGSRIELFSAEGQAFERTIKCNKRSGCVGQKYVDGTTAFRQILKSPIKVLGLIQNMLASLVVYTPDSQGNLIAPGIYSSCGVSADGTRDSLCRYFKNDDMTKAFSVQPTIGKDCVIFRGQSVLDKGEYNEVEEMSFYFPNIEWNVE